MTNIEAIPAALLRFLTTTPLKWDDPRLSYLWERYRAGQSQYKTLSDLEAWEKWAEITLETCGRVQ